MAEVTYFVALPFVATDDGVAAGEPTECFNPIAVVMRAGALSRKEDHVGAVAFSRTGDPATVEFSDAKVLRKFGDVPDGSRRRVRIAGLLQPLRDLRRRYHTFRQMRIERARGDLLGFGQLLFCEVFRLELAAKCLGRSRESSFRR